MAVKKTVKPAKKTVAKRNGKSLTKQVTFKYFNSDASTVSVVGDFNSWNPDKNVMKQAKNGEYSTKVTLSPGRYAYKYLSSNGWDTDPNAECVWDENGNQNSLLVIA